MQNDRICYEQKKAIKAQLIRAIKYGYCTPSLEAICEIEEKGCKCESCNPKADE